MKFRIRQFTAADVAIYKALRLEALQKEGKYFRMSYGEETALPDEEWQNRILNPQFGRFGLYHDDKLIGITAIITEDNINAYMTQSYIRKEYRGRGLSRLLYEARINWAKERNIQKLTVGHRADNISSFKANQHFGFQYKYSQTFLWPDNATVAMHYYELML